LHETYKTFQCQKCDWSLYKIILGRQFEPEEVEELIRNGRVGPLRGIPQQAGSTVRRHDEVGRRACLQDRVRFRQRRAKAPKVTPPRRRRISPARTPLGKCPKCGSSSSTQA
jgi:DNA topoisomerase-3